MDVAKLIKLAAQRYNDLADDGSKVRISDWEWVEFYNDACRQVAIFKPEANSKIATVQLASGVLQTIPDDGVALMDVIQNMGSDGDTAGNIITITKREALDAANLAWPAGTKATAVDNYAFSDEFPLNFWVTPPVSADEKVYVQIGYAALPEEAPDADAWSESDTYAKDAVVLYNGNFYTSLADENLGNTPTTATTKWSKTTVEFALSSIYAGPVKEWMIRLALLKDQESETARDRAQLARQEFYQSLGVKVQSDRGISPNAPKG